MSNRGYLIRDQFAIHFITFAIIQWVDIFTKKEHADIVVESLKFCHKTKGLKIHAWCIMSNHVHLIVSTSEPNRLSDVLRDFKKFTSSPIIKSISENPKKVGKAGCYGYLKRWDKRIREIDHQFLQQDNHPVECMSNEILDSKMYYLHQTR